MTLESQNISGVEEIEQEPEEETVHQDQVVKRSIEEHQQYLHEEQVEQYPTNKRYR